MSYMCINQRKEIIRKATPRTHDKRNTKGLVPLILLSNLKSSISF